MAVGLFKETKVIVQGITGKEGSFHAKMCKEYGTNIVGGVTPGKGGQIFEDILVYDLVEEACKIHNPDMSMIIVPPLFAKDAILEAVEAGIKKIVCITEGIPVHDMMFIKSVIDKNDVLLIGPNTPGIITPEEAKVGIMPGHIFKKGSIGMMSRSGTLVYEFANQIINAGYGISTAVGIGGDSIIGSGFTYWLNEFENDIYTEAIVLVGEIGGAAEEIAADFIKKNISKPVYAFIAGRTAPKGKRMGHAGAIIDGTRGTVDSKDKAFEEAGVMVIKDLSSIGKIIKQTLS